MIRCAANGYFLMMLKGADITSQKLLTGTTMVADKNIPETYTQQAFKYPLIGQEGEIRLYERIKAGDEAALEELICANLRLVVKIAHDYAGKGISFEDIIAEGNIGLMIAAKKFNPNKGAKFSTYSAFWIRQRITRAISCHRLAVYLPERAVRRGSKINSAYGKLSIELGRPPTNEELTSSLGITKRSMKCQVRGIIHVASVDVEINEEGARFIDNLPDESALDDLNALLDKDSITMMLEKMKVCLTERENTILTLRFGLGGDKPMVLNAISGKMGITRERVRQIQDEALAKLREAMSE